MYASIYLVSGSVINLYSNNMWSGWFYVLVHFSMSPEKVYLNRYHFNNWQNNSSWIVERKQNDFTIIQWPFEQGPNCRGHARCNQSTKFTTAWHCIRTQSLSNHSIYICWTICMGIFIERLCVDHEIFWHRSPINQLGYILACLQLLKSESTDWIVVVSVWMSVWILEPYYLIAVTLVLIELSEQSWTFTSTSCAHNLL